MVKGGSMDLNIELSKAIEMMEYGTNVLVKIEQEGISSKTYINRKQGYMLSEDHLEIQNERGYNIFECNFTELKTKGEYAFSILTQIGNIEISLY